MNLVQERNGRTTEIAFSIPQNEFVYVEVIDMDTLTTVDLRVVKKEEYFGASKIPQAQTALNPEKEG
jgi:hypothetical protein